MLCICLFEDTKINLVFISIQSLSSPSLHCSQPSSSSSTSSSTHWWLRGTSESTSSLSLLLLTLWISYGLINAENGASSFGSCGEHVQSDLLWFPHELLV